VYFRLDYYSNLFKIINTIILKKLKKLDYSKSKAFKLIALLDTLEKVLKSIIFRRLRDYIKVYELLLEE